MGESNRLIGSIKRAALYIRVSTDEQAKHGVSLEAQRARLLQYAKENDLVVVDVYADEGISARKKYTRRQEFMRMLEDVKQKKIDVILFIKLDRWFRSVADYYEIQKILDKYKVEWIATEESYDTTTANGRLSLNVKLAIAQDESDRTSDRIKFTFSNMVKEGRVITGTMPKGYRIENKRPVIDPNEAEMVRDLFRHFIDTRSKNATVHYCLEKYNRYIDVKSMKKLLTCSWYIGEAYGVKDYCPAIIDEATYRKSVELIETRAQRNGYERSDRVYLFTGIMQCGCCGCRMTTYSVNSRDKSSKYIYYRCPNHVMRRCEMKKHISQEKMEKWLVENIAVQADLYNMQIKKRQKAAPQKKIDTAKINAKLEKLKDLYLSDLITKDMYEKDYRHLTSLLHEADTSATQKAKPIDTSYFQNFAEIYDTMTLETKKSFWSRILKSVIVSENGDFSVTFFSS